MSRSEIEIETADGTCPASIFRPTGKGPWPAVIVYMDGIGYREAIWEVGERISERGYFVLLPDLFYRAGPYTPADPKVLFSDEKVRQEWFKKFFGTVDQAKVMSDTEAFLAYLSANEDVIPPRVATTGYCMGGGFALAAAGFFPERVVAAAAFHPARLVTEDPTSPHLLAPKMKARVYVGGASEDANFPDDMKQRLDDALTEAHLAHTVVTYPAKHGWVPRDTPVHDPEQAERHFDALFNMLTATLKT